MVWGPDLTMTKLPWAQIRLFTTFAGLTVVIISGFVYNAKQGQSVLDKTASIVHAAPKEPPKKVAHGQVKGTSTATQPPLTPPPVQSPATKHELQPPAQNTLAVIVTASSSMPTIPEPITSSTQEPPTTSTPTPTTSPDTPPPSTGTNTPPPPVTDPAPPVPVTAVPAIGAISVPIGGNSPSYTLHTSDASSVLWWAFNEGVGTSDDETAVKSGFAMFVVIESPYNPLTPTSSITFHIHARATALPGATSDGNELIQLGLAIYNPANTIAPLQSIPLHATAAATS